MRTSIKNAISYILAGVVFVFSPLEAAEKEVVIVNTPDVTIANDPTEPIPVSPVAPPESVLCYKSLGGGGQPSPFARGFSTFVQSLITCPTGVEKVDVQRISFSPDIGGAGDTVNIAKYRLTVSVAAELGGENLAGFVAILTDGAPEATVAQNFRIDTTDSSLFITATNSVTSGIDTFGTSFTGTLFFIGTPVP